MNLEAYVNDFLLKSLGFRAKDGGFMLQGLGLQSWLFGWLFMSPFIQRIERNKEQSFSLLNPGPKLYNIVPHSLLRPRHLYSNPLYQAVEADFHVILSLTAGK